MLNLHRLNLLVELRERQTITAVAEALGYSRTAVSQQLSLLQRELRVPLFVLGPRRVHLTPQGALLADRAEQLLINAREAESAVAALASSAGGTIRIGLFQTVAMIIAPEVLSRLAAAAPQLEVLVRETPPDSAVHALLDHEFDLVAGEEYPGVRHPQQRTVHRENFAGDRLRLVVPDGWDCHGLADLDGRALALEQPGNAARTWADALLREHGVDPIVPYESDHQLVHLRLVQSGLAAGLLSDLVLRDADRVRRLHLPGEPARRLFTAVRAGSQGHPAVKLVRTALREVVEEFDRDLSDDGLSAAIRPACP